MIRLMLAVATILLLPAFANATIILNISGPSSPVGVTPGPIAFTSVDLTNINAPGPSVNTVTLNVSIDETYEFGTPFEWAIAASDNNSPLRTGAEYFVTVNFTNNGFAPVGPVHFELLPIVGSIFIPGTNVNFDTAGGGAFDPLPSAPGYTYIGAHDPTRVVFGGLNGSGGAVPPFGGATAFTFSIDIADIVPVGGPAGANTGNFNLRMVVNPEPASLLLGLSSVGLFGGAIYKRRRRVIAAPAV